MNKSDFSRARTYCLSATAVAVLVASPPLSAQSDRSGKGVERGGDTIETIYVYGEQGKTDTATKLNLSLFETPQTVTAISRAQMDDFALDSVGDVLNYTPGVTVEEVETDRAYYTARGFDIANFQYDGVGVPFTYGINLGQQDTAIYEKVEVVKGAAGLITGLANPSATINYVRKRPTDELQIASGAAFNEWNGVRLDGDVSGALTSTVRGRLVVATEDTDSYLDRHEDSTQLFYGIVEVDLTGSTQLTVGHSYNKSASDGVLWGALPLLYTNGARTDYDVSTSTAPDWTYADTVQNQTFVELKQQLGDYWTANAIFTRSKNDFDSELFYVYGTPDPVDEVGLFGHASGYDSTDEQDVYDIFLSGAIPFAGREHQVALGYSHADIRNVEASYSDFENGFPVLGSDWAAGNTPRPNLVTGDPFNSASDIEQTQKSLYLSSRLNLTDRLSVLLGARRAEVIQRGFSYGGSSDTDAAKTVPYYGVTYQFSDDLMAYASYSEVFKQQTWVNDQFQPLGATEGDNREIGVKKSFNDERAILSLALFQAEHANLGEFVGRDAVTGTAFYEPRAFESDGYEIEFSGEVIDGLNLGAGFTKVNLEDGNGDQARPYVPSELVKMSASYRVPALPALRIGGVLKWQDDITTADGRVEQDAYTLLDLALHYEMSPKLSLALNLENVTDEKYLNSLYWDQAYYGAPRNVEASITWKY
ncbi:MAG: TonB-dependent siderophore receptor [Porticoccaceae bacterium]